MLPYQANTEISYLYIRYLQFSANTEDSVVRKCSINSRTVLYLLSIQTHTIVRMQFIQRETVNHRKVSN